MFDEELITIAQQVIKEFGEAGSTITTAESCTGGLIGAQVASEMAIGAIKNSGSNAAVAVTGIAGPGGGTETKPVGLVYIAVATSDEEGAFVEDFNFTDMNRDEVRRETVKEALEMLLGYGLDDPEEA